MIKNTLKLIIGLGLFVFSVNNNLISAETVSGSRWTTGSIGGGSGVSMLLDFGNDESFYERATMPAGWGSTLVWMSTYSRMKEGTGSSSDIHSYTTQVQRSAGWKAVYGFANEKINREYTYIFARPYTAKTTRDGIEVGSQSFGNSWGYLWNTDYIPGGPFRRIGAVSFYSANGVYIETNGSSTPKLWFNLQNNYLVKLRAFAKDHFGNALPSELIKINGNSCDSTGYVQFYVYWSDMGYSAGGFQPQIPNGPAGILYRYNKDITITVDNYSFFEFGIDFISY